MRRSVPRSRFGRFPACFLLLHLLSLSPLTATPFVVPALPIHVSPQRWLPLLGTTDAALQRRLESVLKKNRLWASLLKNGKMAVGLVDLKAPAVPHFASINGNVMMYAASLPKIAVLLAAFQAFEDGTLDETAEVMEDLNNMIRYSSNKAATRLIDQIGFDGINATLTDPRYRLFDPQQGGGLWVGKRYAKTGGRYPDPLKGLSHAATVAQVCRFYYLLATGRLVNVERSRQMLKVMDNPGLHHKFVHALDQQGTRAHVYRKSGTWKTWHADSMLVWGPREERYILVALVEDPRGEQILRELVPAVQKVLRGGPSRVSYRKTGSESPSENL